MKLNCDYCEAIPIGELKLEYLEHMKYHTQHCSGYDYCPHNLNKDGKEVVDMYPLHKDIRCDGTSCFCDYYDGMDIGNGKGKVHIHYDNTQDTTKLKYRRE